jgi:TRAP-type uncharacterized transport system substrate-binding protein
MSAFGLGDKYIVARKMVRGPTDGIYITSEQEFFMNSEDVRVINMKHSEVQVRKSARALTQAASNKKTYKIEDEDMETLKNKCWESL